MGVMVGSTGVTVVATGVADGGMGVGGTTDGGREVGDETGGNGVGDR